MTATTTIAPVAAVYRVLLRELLSVGRAAVIGGLAFTAIASGFAVGRNSDESEQARRAANFIEDFGLVVVVPVIALVFAAAVIGDLREDRTLVYLWLRPMATWVVPVAGFAAAATVVVPAVAVPLVLSAALAGGDASVLAGTAIASTLGALAYCSVFVVASIVVKRVLLWGLAYILIWEGFIASSDGAARLALRSYTSSILADLADVELGLGVHSVTTALLVLVPVTVIAMVLAVVRHGRATVD